MKPSFGFFLFLPLLALIAEEGYHYQVYLTPKATGEIEVEEIYRFSQESETTKGLLFLKLPKNFFQNSGFKKISLYENNLALKPLAIVEKNPKEKAIYFEKLKGTTVKLRYLIDNIVNFENEKGKIELYLLPFTKEEILSFKIFFLMDSVTYWESICAGEKLKTFKKKSNLSFQIIDVQEQMDECKLNIEFQVPESWRKKLPQKGYFFEEYKFYAMWFVFLSILALFWPVKLEKVFFFIISLAFVGILLWAGMKKIFYYSKIFFWEQNLNHGVVFIWNFFLHLVFLSFSLLVCFFYIEPNRRHDFSMYLWAFALPCLIISSLFFLEIKNQYQLLIFISSLTFLLRPKIKNYFLFMEKDLEKIIHSLPVKITLLEKEFFVPKELILNKIKILFGYPFAIDNKNQKIVLVKKNVQPCNYCGEMVEFKKRHTCDFCGKKIILTKTSPLPNLIYTLKYWAQITSWAFAFSFLASGIFFVTFLLTSETKNISLWLTSLIFPVGALFFYYLSRNWTLQIEKGLGFELSIFLLLSQIIFLFPIVILFYLTKKGNKFYFGFFQKPLFTQKKVSLKELSHLWKLSPWDSHILAIHLTHRGILNYDYFKTNASLKKSWFNSESVKYR